MHNLDQYNLSRREVEVVEKISQGITNKEAAHGLFVSEKTVKFHLTNIFKKMGVTSRSQLIVKVMMIARDIPEVVTPTPAQQIDPNILPVPEHQI